MDYGINGIFKNLCNRRTATTKSELVKVEKEVWSEIKIRKVNKAWPFCVDLMVEKLGFLIEHFSQCRRYSGNERSIINKVRKCKWDIL